jgi:hypothetical protein
VRTWFAAAPIAMLALTLHFVAGVVLMIAGLRKRH